VLEYADLPEPAVGDRQVLVKVHAAGVNPVDSKLRRGTPRLPFLRWPRIPGSDIAGEIVRVGRSVTRFQPGEAVYAMLSPFSSSGGCAEYAAVPERAVARKPGKLTFEEAAAVPLAALTALQALRDQGRITRGHGVLVNGASGGVGSFAVQIARVYGAEVTAVGGSGERRIPIASFFTGPFMTALAAGEILTEIRIPVPPPRSGGAYRKLERKVGDFATAAAAVQVSLNADGTIRTAGVALSAAGACAVRVNAAEQLLAGQKPTAELIRAVSDAAWQRSAPQADLRGTVEFKKHLAGVLVARGVRQALARLGVQS